MYFFSKTKNLEEYINQICKAREIGITYRIECAKSLEENGYVHINSIFNSEKDKIKTLSTPVRIDTVLFLMKSEKFKEEAREYFCDIINDSSIEEIYRYKTIQKLESTFEASKTAIPLRIQRKKKIEISENNIKKFIYYAKEACIRFVKNERNTFTYRTLACQYLFEKCNIDDSDCSDFLEKFLMSVADNQHINDDVRADACDVILQYGSEESREGARNIIYILGGGDRVQNNIFKNAQNVHVRSIEESVQKIIDRLIGYHPRNKKFYDFNQSKDDIHKLIENEEKETKQQIEGALIRIGLDRAVYGTSNVSLSTILSHVWTYIQDSEFKAELEKRLLEELVESNNKCSTGYASRLVNTLSGFDENMSVTISYEDQIVSNLEGRLNARIRLIQNEEYMEKVLTEMTIPVLFFHQRMNFLKFFRENISKIREDMYDEFRHHMTDIDYDFYFRKAIIHYEGYNC
jgi:CRISPR/Cas system-associated endoribonuclease Cas2